MKMNGENDRLDLAFLKEEKERFVCRIGCFVKDRLFYW